MFHLKTNSRQLFYDQLSELCPFVFCSFFSEVFKTHRFPDIFEKPEGLITAWSLDSLVSWLVKQPKEASLKVIFDN